jgi:hypothetical protein
MNRHAPELNHPRHSSSTAEHLHELLRRRDENLDVMGGIEPGVEATPQVARSLQATENRWRRIEREFGMLDSGQVAEFLGASGTNRNLAHSLAKKGQILGVKRGRKTLFPGFQFDADSGEVRPVIAQVASIGRQSGWEDRHLLQWLCTPNGYLDGARPVDHIADEVTLLQAAESDLAVRW